MVLPDRHNGDFILIFVSKKVGAIFSMIDLISLNLPDGANIIIIPADSI